MFSNGIRNHLSRKQKIPAYEHADKCPAVLRADDRPLGASLPPRNNFLRIPPFPGARVQSFSGVDGQTADPSKLSEVVRQLRIGGTYWGGQPELPSDYVLVRSVAAVGATLGLRSGRELLIWQSQPVPSKITTKGRLITGDCDPWHMLASASAVVTEACDEIRVIAALLGVVRYLFDPAKDELRIDTAEPEVLLSEALPYGFFEDPFTGKPMDAIEALELCGFWRGLIDSNRGIAGGMGFSFWKQGHVAPLLWSGSGPFRFLRGSRDVRAGSEVAVWRSKTAPQAIADLEQRGVKLIEVEDGFLRSSGLGADCVPPLSITVDKEGNHFDPSCRSELEMILEHGSFDESLLRRARDLRLAIVAAALGKYGRGAEALERPAGSKVHILVPGQVEDDLAVRAGGCGLMSNLELLKKVRDVAPDAYILFKPHPDVLAGHRRGAVSEELCLQYADQVVLNAPIASLLDMVDEVHVNTSLAGFEALLRETSVTTYGVPFYAGWGLTRDLGPVPRARTVKRSLDELIAAALILYPRYLDPFTRLPCPAEVIVRRLSLDDVAERGFVIGARRFQGRLKRSIRSLIQ